MRRIGLLGAGWVARHHLAAYRELAGRARVAAICDPSEAARSARAAEYGIPGTYADAAALLDAEALDAVDIAAPREYHAALCRLAAGRGLPVLCQKPLAPTLAEAEALVAALRGRVRLMVHENWRFRPHYRLIRRWLDEGRVGPLRQIVMAVFTAGLVSDARGRRPAVERQPFFAELERLLLMEVLIHHVDTLRFLAGPLALDAARLGRAATGLRGEDRAMLMMSSPAGAAVVLVGDFMAHGSPPAQFDRVEILGESGAIRLTGPVLEVFGDQPERQTLDLDADYRASYVGAIGHFLDRLDDGRPFETAPEDNLETLRIVERAYAIGAS